MKKTRYTEDQLIGILREVEGGKLASAYGLGSLDAQKGKWYPPIVSATKNGRGHLGFFDQ